MDQTATRFHGPADGDEEETKNALFGSRSKLGGITYQYLGLLSRTTSEDRVNYTFSITASPASDELPRPPRGVRPVSLPLQAAGKLFGHVEVNCVANFEYDLTQGFRSKISFPIPLILPGGTEEITHIEGAEFSHRANDNVQYRIRVAIHEDANLLDHWITFESNLELSQNSIRGLLDKARAISSRLLVRANDE